VDLKLPKLDGEALSREIRLHDPSVPIVLMTGYQGDSVMGRFGGLNVSGLLQKPFMADELADSVSAALGDA
tara:strand:+ start:16802 stop:17014 length:213 start_codon:yes stop_codon:yes gene_type:complete